MSAAEWPRPPIEIVQEFEARSPGRRGEVTALIMWATWSVEGLHYLDELDELRHQARLPVTGHSPEIFNIAHVRWATSSAITSLDLCAAVLARECCGWNGPKELNLRHFDPSTSKKPKVDKISLRRKALPTAALEWVDKVLADQRYKEVLSARNPLIHSRLIRKLYSTGPNFTEFMIDATGNDIGTRDLVRRARDLATDSVAAFLKVVEKLS
jgi:hypothetical protein